MNLQEEPGQAMAGLPQSTISEAALEILQRIYGHSEFRNRQAEIIEQIAGGGNALVLMPTGGGKSLCYQIPSMMRPGVGLVISPLIALMQDQVTALEQLGVSAACLHSGLEATQAHKIWDALRAGELDMLYVAPERVLSESFLAGLESAKVDLALIAIDEAHCVSQWGHDFRPEYLRLAELLERFPGVPYMALTATADLPTRREMIEKLGLAGSPVYTLGFDRPNIEYRVQAKENANRQLFRFIEEEHAGQSGIIYALSRKRVEKIASALIDKGFRALPYHAGLDSRTRSDHQEKFVRDEVDIIVATVAFGMGIDKPDVRFVVHYDPPKSLEAYYQETGRAGRDGLPATAYMIYGLADIALLRRMISGGEAENLRQTVEHRKLDALLGYAETTRCRRQRLLEYFGRNARRGLRSLRYLPASGGDHRRYARSADGALGHRAQRPALWASTYHRYCARCRDGEIAPDGPRPLANMGRGQGSR